MSLVLVHPLEKDKTLFIVQNLHDIHDCLYHHHHYYFYYYYDDDDDVFKIQKSAHTLYMYMYSITMITDKKHLPKPQNGNYLQIFSQENKKIEWHNLKPSFMTV